LYARLRVPACPRNGHGCRCRSLLWFAASAIGLGTYAEVLRLHRAVGFDELWAASPRFSSSRIAAARLGMRTVERQLSSASTSWTVSMISRRSPRVFSDIADVLIPATTAFAGHAQMYAGGLSHIVREDAKEERDETGPAICRPLAGAAPWPRDEGRLCPEYDSEDRRQAGETGRGERIEDKLVGGLPWRFRGW
jgi:hypothetical protein